MGLLNAPPQDHALMASDAYRKTGRGGAGNFYRQGNIDRVTKKDTEDVEAQSTAFHPETLTSDRPLSDYTHAGRGGVGNWYSPVDLQKHRDSLSEVMAMKSVHGVREARCQGRGGAGNFKVRLQEESMIEEERKLKEEHMERDKIVQIVDADLARPEKAHLGSQGWGEVDSILV